MAAGRVGSELAARQKGVASRRQLLNAGLTGDAITGLIRRGFLHRLHRGVYAVGHTALPKFGLEQAALLACGEGAVLSGRSALYVWGIGDSASGDVEVSIAGRHCRKRQGIRLHLVQSWRRREIRTSHGLRLVSPARALIDFAADASFDQLGDAVAEARQSNLIRDGELEAALQAAGPRRGAGKMRAFLSAEAEPAITRSRAERRFRKLLQAAQLPQPRVNVRIAGVEVDFLWEDEKIVLEVDGWKFHSDRRSFEWDRKKAMILSDAGFHVIRITWRQFTQEPLALIAHIARALDRRGRLRH